MIARRAIMNAELKECEEVLSPEKVQAAIKLME
jgi:hypothetical protein